MTPEKLAEILAAHKLWLNDEKGGVRADLSGADLSKANLSGATLRGADPQRGRPQLCRPQLCRPQRGKRTSFCR